jgi:hypothetical protein
MARMADVIASPPLASSPARLGSPWRWLAICLGLPSLIALVDYALLDRGMRAQPGAMQLSFQFVWYIVQVGAISYFVGRGVKQPVLRWFVFGWILLLVDFITVTMALTDSQRWMGNYPYYLPPAGLFAGQIGLCVVWAIHGDGRWPIRLPAMAFAAAALFSLWLAFGEGYDARMWTELLVLQLATLAVLCGLLRLRGFRLSRIESISANLAAGDTQRRQLQFNIKHVLIWTTALAVILGIAKGFDLLTWQAARELAGAGIFWKMTVAAASAMVIIVALWVALGQGNAAVRYFVGVLFALTIGSGLALWGLAKSAGMAGPGWPWSRINWELRMWYDVGWWWLGWLFLSGGLLAATLIILRTLDYRLVRIRRHGR